MIQMPTDARGEGDSDDEHGPPAMASRRSGSTTWSTPVTSATIPVIVNVTTIETNAQKNRSLPNPNGCS